MFRTHLLTKFHIARPNSPLVISVKTGSYMKYLQNWSVGSKFIRRTLAWHGAFISLLSFFKKGKQTKPIKHINYKTERKVMLLTIQRIYLDSATNTKSTLYRRALDSILYQGSLSLWFYIGSVLPSGQC